MGINFLICLWISYFTPSKVQIKWGHQMTLKSEVYLLHELLQKLNKLQWDDWNITSNKCNNISWYFHSLKVANQRELSFSMTEMSCRNPWLHKCTSKCQYQIWMPYNEALSSIYSIPSPLLEEPKILFYCTFLEASSFPTIISCASRRFPFPYNIILF